MKQLITIDCETTFSNDFSFLRQEDQLAFQNLAANSNTCFAFLLPKTSHKQAKRLKRSLNLKQKPAYIIANQGTRIVALHKKGSDFELDFSKSDFYPAYLYAQIHNLNCAFLSNDCIYCSERLSYSLTKESKALHLSVIEDDSFIDQNDFKAQMMIVSGSCETLNAVETGLRYLMKEQYHCVRTSLTSVEIVKKGCSFEQAIKTICQKEQIETVTAL